MMIDDDRIRWMGWNGVPVKVVLDDDGLARAFGSEWLGLDRYHLTTAIIERSHMGSIIVVELPPSTRIRVVVCANVNDLDVVLARKGRQLRDVVRQVGEGRLDVGYTRVEVQLEIDQHETHWAGWLLGHFVVRE